MKVNKQLVQKKMIEEEWTREELCNQANISLPTLHRVMSNKSIKPKTVAKLVKVVGVPIDDLIDDWD